jgi:hypothetical protein
MDTTIESQKAMDNSGEDIDSGPLANALRCHIRDYYGIKNDLTKKVIGEMVEKVGEYLNGEK